MSLQVGMVVDQRICKKVSVASNSNLVFHVLWLLLLRIWGNYIISLFEGVDKWELRELKPPPSLHPQDF